MALKIEEIRAAAERVAVSFGMEVVELEFQGNAKARILRVYLEKNEAERARMVEAAQREDAEPLPKGVAVESLSGVTHEDCALFAQDFGTLLDVEDLVPGSEYTLEVSSPGLERKLTALRGLPTLSRKPGEAPDRPSHPGQPAMARTPANGGVEGEVTLDLSAVKQKGKAKKATSEETITIPLAEIEKANLVAEI